MENRHSTKSEDRSTGVQKRGPTADRLPSESPGQVSKIDLDYFREARLFLAPNRATITFYADNEVASIHFDLIRDEIFYKGHNVKNMTLTDNQWMALQKFSDYLVEVPKSEKLRQAYQACLFRLLPRGF